MDPEQRAAILSLPGGPEPRPEDVASPEAIVQAVYASISGPTEVERDRSWDVEGFIETERLLPEDRWWIAHLVWDVERPDNPLPQDYLQGMSS